MAYEWLADLTLEDLQTSLTAARVAYNRVILGESVRVSVDRSGERAEFNSTNQRALLAYIEALRQEIALRENATPRLVGPLGFTF